MGSGFKPTDQRAIRWFFQENPHLKPQMAAYPHIAYEENGKRVEKHVNYIRILYADRKEKHGA